MAINLLPTELSPRGPAVKAANALRRFIIFGFIAFALSVLGLIAFFVFVTTQIGSSNQRQESLKGSIRSLEQTEQRLILVKDRLAKIKNALGEEKMRSEVENIDSLLTNTAGNVVVTEVDVSKDKTELTVQATSSTSVAQFMAVLLVTNLYEKIDLSSFGFNPQVGYLISLEMAN